MSKKNDLSKYPAGNWRTPDTPRVKYLKTNEVGPVSKILFKIAAKETGTEDPINVFGVLGHLRKVFPFYLIYFNMLYKHGKIDVMEKEIITLRTAWNLGSLYEYVHHRDFLEKAGYAADVIDSYTAEDLSTLDARLQTILPAVDDIVQTHTVSEEHMKGLKKYYDDDQLVEFLMFVGYFIMIGVIIDAGGVVLED